MTVLLKDLAYYRTGGTCEALYQPRSIPELQEALAQIRRDRSPFFLLGGGTNSLVMDDHWPGAVIALAVLSSLKINGASVYVEAGVENSALARSCADAGLAGVEWMYRLPGQMGGTVRMNARCYGGEISQVCARVIAVTPLGLLRDYREMSVFRGYKDTVFMENGEIIAAAELTLKSGDKAALEETMRFCESDRQSKGQFLFPSCGCVFKNDYSVGIPSGKLLEAAGAKGMRVGGAEVSPYHANFVYNKGATSRQILELSLMMREAVYRRFGVWLAYEMEMLGAIPADLAVAIREKRQEQRDVSALEALRRRA